MDRDGDVDRGFPGNHVLSSAHKTFLMVPKFNEGPLVFRPFPAPDYEEPMTKLQPGREAAEPTLFTHWMVKVVAASYVGMEGCEKATFLLYDPINKTLKDDNPYLLFQKAAEAAHKSAVFSNNKKWDSTWNKLFIGKKGEGKAIKPAESLYFTQAAVYSNGKKDYMADTRRERTKPLGLQANDALVVLQMSISAGKQIKAVFDLEKDAYDGAAPADLSLPFVNGDPVGRFLPKKGVVAGGKIFRVFNSAVTAVTPASNNSLGLNDSGEGFGRYDVELLAEYRANKTVYTPRLDEDDVKVVFDKAQFWFDSVDGTDKGLLYFPSHEEQKLYIARAFKFAPKLVIWALAEHPEPLSDDVKGVLASRVSASIPASSDAPGDDDGDGDGDAEAAEAPSRGKSQKVDPTVRAAKTTKTVLPSDDEQDDAGYGAPEYADTPPDDEEGETADVPPDDEQDDSESEEAPPPPPPPPVVKKTSPAPASAPTTRKSAPTSAAPAVRKSPPPPPPPEDEQDEQDAVEAEAETEVEVVKPAPLRNSLKTTSGTKTAPPPPEEETDDGPPSPKTNKPKTATPASTTSPKLNVLKGWPPVVAVDFTTEPASPQPEDADEEAYLSDDANDVKTKTSLKAAEGAKDRSKNRATPTASPPAGPTSKGGVAPKK